MRGVKRRRNRRPRRQRTPKRREYEERHTPPAGENVSSPNEETHVLIYTYVRYKRAH